MRPVLSLLLMLPPSLANGGDPLPDPQVRPSPVALSDEEWNVLRNGEIIYRAEEMDKSRIVGISAALVAAPPEIIWQQVIDFDAYVDFLPYITASRRLEIRGDENETVIVASLELTTLGIVTRYQMDNFWHPVEGYLNWTMAPRSTNPLQRIVGSWQVHPTEGAMCLVTYRAEVDMRWWVPDFLQVKARDRGLPTLVRLIRRRAEAQVEEGREAGMERANEG